MFKEEAESKEPEGTGGCLSRRDPKNQNFCVYKFRSTIYPRGPYLGQMFISLVMCSSTESRDIVKLPGFYKS